MLRNRLRPRKPVGDEGLDPMAALANLLDIMLVFACGLMVALVLSWRLQNVLFDPTVSPQQKKQMLQAVQKMVQVEKGRRLQQMPDLAGQGGGAAGYNEMGTVFRDPKTGKLFMVKKSRQ
ncbi:MAG: DUF2149 domain-containing protein [Bacillota bacterium]|jgi:hypothetical protein